MNEQLVDGQMEPDGLKDKLAEAYRLGSEGAIQKVLAEVEHQADKRIRAGFGETNFTLGVLNTILIVYIFSAFPQHFWILYLVEAFLLIPIKFALMIRAKPLNQALYYLDFCWIMNFLGVAGLVCLFSGKDHISSTFRKHLFLAAYGICCGPLLGATAVLPFVALIFHDVTTMTSLFIHIFPPVLVYVLRWRSDEVTEAWPNSFYLNHEVVFFPGGANGTSFFDSVFGNALSFYLLWFVFYTVWQVFIGLDLPRSQRHKRRSDGKRALAVYDTVFHSTMRGSLVVTMGKILWKRPTVDSLRQSRENDFEMKDLIVYMMFHMIAVIMSLLTLAYPCSISPVIHGTFIVILTVICAWRGAKRYTFYCTEMYAKLIRKQFLNKD